MSAGNIAAAHAFTELDAVGQADVPVRFDMYRVRTKVAMRVADAAFCGALSDERIGGQARNRLPNVAILRRFLADRVADERRDLLEVLAPERLDRVSGAVPRDTRRRSHIDAWNACTDSAIRRIRSSRNISLLNPAR